MSNDAGSSSCSSREPMEIKRTNERKNGTQVTFILVDKKEKAQSEAVAAAAGR